MHRTLVLPLLALLAPLGVPPRTLVAQPSAPTPGCVQEPLAELSSNGLAVDADGSRVAFISNEDPFGTNPGHLNQLFLWREGRGFVHLENTNRPRTFDVSTDAQGRRIAFVSDAPLTPANRGRKLQVFLWDEVTGTQQLTRHDLDEVFQSSIDASGTRVAFVRSLVEAPVTNPVGYELVLWEEGAGERVLVAGTDPLDGPAISGDGRHVVFVQPGYRFDEPSSLRLWDEGAGSARTLVELGIGVLGDFDDPVIDGAGDRIAFSASLDLVGSNPDLGPELFLWDASQGLRQLTDSGSGASFWPSISDDGRAVAFLSNADPLGANPDRLQQVFLWRQSPAGTETLTQVTAWTPGPDPDHPGGASQPAISRDGTRVAHLLYQLGPPGTSTPARREIWLSRCDVPGAPFASWLRGPDLPGFEVQVRIGGAREGAMEPLCIPETLCASGAVPGRSEVFVRVVGPKPNGRLWPTLVKFSTSEVEVWIRQLSTGEIEYYRRRGARPGISELPGLFDREGFQP